MTDRYPAPTPFARSARALPIWQALAAVTGLGLGACATADTWQPGRSDRPPVVAERPRTPAVSSAEPWAPLASASSFVAVDDRQMPSSGHNPPYWSGMVRVNATLREPYQRLAPGQTVPEGSIALESHLDLNGATQSLYAMEKRAPGFDPGGGDWDYVVLSPTGQVESRGALSFCSRCHAEAPHDHLFGPRLSARRHVLNAPGSPAEGTQDAEDDGATAPDENVAPGTPGSAPKPDRPRPKKRRH